MKATIQNKPLHESYLGRIMTGLDPSVKAMEIVALGDEDEINRIMICWYKYWKKDENICIAFLYGPLLGPGLAACYLPLFQWDENPAYFVSEICNPEPTGYLYQRLNITVSLNSLCDLLKAGRTGNQQTDIGYSVNCMFMFVENQLLSKVIRVDPFSRSIDTTLWKQAIAIAEIGNDCDWATIYPLIDSCALES